MKVNLDELRAKLKTILLTSGASEADVDTMVEMRLQYDLHGNTFSGIEDVEKILQELRDSIGSKIIYEIDKPSIKLVNANGRAAELVGMEVIPSLAKAAKETGICVLGIYNSTYHGILETYSREIAKHDLIALVSANGGPQGVVPYGGRKDVFGTNPFSYAIPTHDIPIVFDAATAKYAYGTIRLAKKKGQVLPESSYLDDRGEWTTDPLKAVSIVPFGEHKGYAINLMLEVLTGALVQAKSGLLVQEEKDLGAVFIAIDPSAFGSLKNFKDQTSKIVEDIAHILPAEGFAEVRVPGMKGEALKRVQLESGEVDIEDHIWREFLEVYRNHV